MPTRDLRSDGRPASRIVESWSRNVTKCQPFVGESSHLWECSRLSWFKIVILYSQAGPKNSVGCKSSFSFPPSPPLLSLPCHPLPSLFPFPPLPPQKQAPPQLRLGGLGEHLSSPSRSGWSPAAKRILTHFRPKFAPFEYLMQLTDTLSHNIISHKRDEPITRLVDQQMQISNQSKTLSGWHAVLLKRSFLSK